MRYAAIMAAYFLFFPFPIGLFTLILKKIFTLIGALSKKIVNFAYPMGRNPLVQKAFSLSSIF